MTEKRFQYNVNKNCIEYDGKFVAYLNSVDGCRIANYWNGLYKENEQLRHDATILIQSNQEYRRENEQLKKEIERITKEKENWAFISDCSVQVMNEEEKFKEDYLRIATNDLKKLQGENEQLKRRNKKLEKHLRKFYCDEEWKLRELLGDFE